MDTYPASVPPKLWRHGSNYNNHLLTDGGCSPQVPKYSMHFPCHLPSPPLCRILLKGWPRLCRGEPWKGGLSLLTRKLCRKDWSKVRHTHLFPTMPNGKKMNCRLRGWPTTWLLLFFQPFKNKTCMKIKIKRASRKEMSPDIWNQLTMCFNI